MKRREFVKKAGLATVGAFSVPYLLPSGRLFAASGLRKVNHVVFCLFAGGVRNLESVQKGEGNLLRNILNGTEAITGDISGSMDALPASPLASPLQNYGTLFKNVRYKSGPTGHYNGHTTAITGAYTLTDLNIKDHPKTPTIFEFYRKHNSPSQTALKSWWISNTLGPYPALNFSSYPGYGTDFAANFIAPTVLISNNGYDALGNLKTFNSNEQATVENVRNFMNNNFGRQYVNGDAGVTNTAADTADLQAWITTLLNDYHAGLYYNPWGAGSAMNNDMYNIFFAEELIKRYHPELVVVNMQDVDVCHFNFTNYCNNLRKADYAVAHLWNTIQNTPGMADDTVLVVAPEHGRNLNGNTSRDQNNRPALDHTANFDGSGDQMSRDIFCLIVGPPNVVHQGQVIDTLSGQTFTGESIEIVPVIANLLGFDDQIPGTLLRGYDYCDLRFAFI